MEMVYLQFEARNLIEKSSQPTATKSEPKIPLIWIKVKYQEKSFTTNNDGIQKIESSHIVLQVDYSGFWTMWSRKCTYSVQSNFVKPLQVHLSNFFWDLDPYCVLFRLGADQSFLSLLNRVSVMRSTWTCRGKSYRIHLQEVGKVVV